MNKLKYIAEQTTQKKDAESVKVIKPSRKQYELMLNVWRKEDDYLRAHEKI